VSNYELDLSNQDLSGWDLSDANLKDAVLRGTRLLGAKIKPNRLLKAKFWKEAELDDDLRRKALNLEWVQEHAYANFLKKVDDFGFSAKTYQGLASDNIIYVGDLLQKSETELLRTPNFGRKSLNEVKEALAPMGLHLGMEVPNWPPENIEELVDGLEDERGKGHAESYGYMLDTNVFYRVAEGVLPIEALNGRRLFVTDEVLAELSGTGAPTLRENLLRAVSDLAATTLPTPTSNWNDTVLGEDRWSAEDRLWLIKRVGAGIHSLQAAIVGRLVLVTDDKKLAQMMRAAGGAVVASADLLKPDARGSAL
jgi:hypothetical protein